MTMTLKFSLPRRHASAELQLSLKDGGNHGATPFTKHRPFTAPHHDPSGRSFVVLYLLRSARWVLSSATRGEIMKPPNKRGRSRNVASSSSTSLQISKLILSALVLLPTAPLHAGWTQPTKLDPKFNGPGDDWAPFITANSMRFYWSSSSFPEGFGINEDIYFTEWDSSIADWGPRVHLDSAVNTIEREFSPCESPDGRYLWFIRYNGFASYDLFYSIRDTVNNRWQTAQNAGPQFNSNCIEWSVGISPDGRRMFLSHGIRPGTIGCEGEVLWISYWNDSAQWWDSLIWMGNTVNQGATQTSATMSWDTSFFLMSSASIFPGAPTFGGYDMYLVPNRPPLWDSLVNLGMPPNSADWDEAVALSSDGLTLYFASGRDPLTSDYDIYVSTDVPDLVQEHPAPPPDLTMGAPHPNPFNSSTEVDLSLSKAGRASLLVYNSLGQVVDDVFNGSLPAGVHTFIWKPADVASGVYWLRASVGPQATARRILYLK